MVSKTLAQDHFKIIETYFRVNAEFILVSMGQDPELTSMAQTYIIFSIPYLFLSYANTTIRKFLQSIGKSRIRIHDHKLNFVFR